jgi:hypothetical protein
VLATKDTGLILVPAGAVRPAVVCSGHCIALHRGARRAGLQAWRERRPGLQVPEVLIEASANIVARAESVRVIAVRRRVSSLRLGGRPSFHRPRRGRFTGVPHYSPTCVGMASSATELTTVLANLIPVTASWRALCPNRSGFEGGGVAVGCLAVVHGQARGGRPRRPVRGIAAGMATSCPRASQQCRGCRCSTRRGAAVMGMAAQS